MEGKIVPKTKAKGVDICGVGKNVYIVRSDLGCYMRSTNFHRGEDLEVFHLHPSCRDGDHYLADKNDLFYIIKGNCYRQVKSMNTDEENAVYTLHPNCQGGDHYLSAWDSFFIIFLSRGVYRTTKNLHRDEDSVEYPLHPDCKDGLYYFGTEDYYYMVKPQDKWGIQYVKSTKFNENKDSETFSFHPSVINFLPGGVGVTKGPARGEWVCIKTISNEINLLEMQNKIPKKIGYEKEKMSCIEQNWKVNYRVVAETGGLSKAICRSQFSLTAEYGGCSVNTGKEDWSDATEVKEVLNVIPQPDEKIYIWAFQLCLGNDPVLYCSDMRILDDANPPTDVPLPPAPLLMASC
ncbi:hypothetical protein GDO81_021718 [Engystomops pustulosus]|uniref:DUF295 domain-containing protein n=1 Tax=Engystomops pustulosus TaxID=76066 RepID=A0AAV6YS81_ENGPU|nr:hypothetical protein GDO81_021718 [Engystomops pustulosus]